MSLLVGAASNSATGYTLNNSLRFRSSASAYLGRTPSSGGNQKTWTFSCWTKRGALTGSQVIFGAANSANSQFVDVTINGNNVFELDILDSNSTRTIRTSTAVLRDPSAWYHIVLVIDTTQATDTDRIKLYVNNELLTTSAGTGTYPALNADTQVNATTGIHAIARRQGSADRYYDGYITEINLIDGTALTPSAFGETDDNGTWVPKKYTGTYGTNGFYLDFEDTSSVAALGTDSSGNGNTWTVNNVSLTAGTTYDSMKDVPTLTDEDTANFATLNPLDNNGVALTEGNLTGVIAVNENVSATIAPTSGKWYWEVYVVDNTNPYIGIKKTESNTTGYTGEAVGINNVGDIYFNGSIQPKDGLPGFSNTNIVGIALNVDAQKIWWSKNGQWYTADAAGESAIASSEVAAGNNGYDYSSQITNAKPYVGSSASNGSVTLNFGQRPFSYTPPTGFLKLNTFNLPDSAIEDGSTNFNTVLYTGTGAIRSVTGVGFQPDFVWGKARNTAYSSNLYDSVRGATKYMYSNATSSEVTEADSLTSFDSDGFSTGANAGAGINYSGVTYVAWNWKANGAGVSNGDGSITSTVSANPTAGFSVVTYGGNSTAGATVGHGLGIVPDMVIVKNRTGSSGFQNWGVYHSSLLNTQAMFLNTNGAVTANTTYWNNTTPTASVFSLGYTGTDGWNITGQNFVAYCFAEVEGYSKFSSYNGNGSTDGPFVYLGFKPAFIMIKYTVAGISNWMTYDSTRNTSNVVNDYLVANEANAEATKDWLDITANGFKIRNTDNTVNTINYTSGGTRTFIYMAFAENPFKNSTAR